jgi:hydrophobic/amphiphilic exporter-1 (mainly G- bacteria), HAE1 family
LTALHGRLWPFLASGYDRLLKAALGARVVVLLTAAVVAAGGAMLLPRLGADLIPPLAQGVLTLQLELSEGTPLDRTERVCSEIQQELKQIDGVQRVAATVGVSRDQGAGPIRRKENHAEIHLLLQDASPQVEEAVLRQARRLVAERTSARLDVRRPALMNLNKPVQVDVFGHDLQALQRASASVSRMLRDVRGLRDIREVMVPGSPEILISLDRHRLGQMQLDQEEVFRTIQAKVAGVVPARFRDGERHIDIRLRGQSDDRATLAAVEGLVVARRDEITVTLGSIASLIESRGPAEIHRLGGRRATMVTADLVGRDQGSVNREIADQLLGLSLPAGTVARLGRQSDEMQQSFRSLQLAILLAVFLVYLVMASQFESILHPLIIMVTVPLALSGAVFGLAISGRPLSIFAVIGAIMLAGIVVNNGIVLIDRMNQLRRDGLDLMTAVCRAGRERLRPILMTTTTTVLGLLPMALGIGEGAELRSALALTVICGLLLSTGLTLLVVPVLYTLISGMPGVLRPTRDGARAALDSLAALPAEPEG